MLRHEDNLVSRLSGNTLQPLAGISVTVTDNVTGLPASLYSDNGITPITAPIITDENGYYGFNAPDGSYTMTFTGVRIAPFTRQIVLDDPKDNPYATKAELAAGTGSALVMFTQAGTGAVPRPLQDKARESVSVKDFGAVGDGVADDTAAIQSAINYAMYTANIGTVYMPSGTYKTSDTIHVGYGTDFRQLHLMGAGGTYRGQAAFGGTTIKPTFTDRPGIVAHGLRRGRMSGFAVIGKNFDYVSTRDLGGISSTTDDTVLSAWLDPALSANANSRYAPYAGIAVDPYIGVAPTPAYPAVTYPAFLGTVSQYGKARSDTVTVEDVYIAGFVVNAVIQPCNDDGNGDFVTFRNCMLEFAPYQISAGNSQGRNVNMDNVAFRNFHTALTNNKHGKQIGKFGGHVRGCHFDRGIQIFDLDGGQCGPMVFDGCYAELLWRFGVQAAATRQYPITFISGEYSLSNHPAIRGVPAKIASGLVTMAGISVQLPSMNCADGVKFTDCAKVETYDTSLVTPSAARLAAQKGTGGVLPLAAALALDPSDDLISVLDAGSVRRAFPMANSSGRGSPFNRINRHMRFSDNTATLPPVTLPFGWSGAQGKAAVPASLTGITGTLDFTTSYAALFPFGISAGDVVMDDQTGTIFLVESMAAAVATVTAQNNYFNSGSGNAFRTAVSTSAGTWYVFSSRIYGTSSPNYGTTTSGSAVISNVGRADGYAGFLTSDLAAGDYLWRHDHVTNYFPAGAKVNSFDTTARTITMSAPATKTAADVPMHIWVKP